MTDTQWSRADRAAYALQAHFGESHTPPGSKTYGDEGSVEFDRAVVSLLVDLKHLLYRVGGARYMLTDLAEEAVDLWAEEADTLPLGGDEEQ